jgi:hypothetical protein
MALITRVSRLFRADVNAVLDRMEEPEILLRQAVREMEEEVDREAQRARLIELELKQIAGLREQWQVWAERARVLPLPISGEKAKEKGKVKGKEKGKKGAKGETPE